jgi:23S rRNA (pseudouridine1915-N3)-methyltransferase
MKIQITTIGKLKDKNIHSLIEEYIKRTPWQIKIVEIENNNKSRNPDSIKTEEEKLLMSKIPNGYYKIALDETGNLLSSEELAKHLQKIAVNKTGNIAFIIGGAEGLSANLKSSVNDIISLGKMTYPHMIARMLLVEQIYRTYTIIEGKSYHK